MSTKFRVPGYCVHTARNQAYVRLNGEIIYLGAPGSPESREKYDRLIAEWMASGRTYVKPAQRDGISVNEVLLAYRRFAESYYVNLRSRRIPVGGRLYPLMLLRFAWCNRWLNLQEMKEWSKHRMSYVSTTSFGVCCRPALRYSRTCLSAHCNGPILCRLP